MSDYAWFCRHDHSIQADTSPHIKACIFLFTGKEKVEEGPRAEWPGEEQRVNLFFVCVFESSLSPGSVGTEAQRQSPL